MADPEAVPREIPTQFLDSPEGYEGSIQILNWHGYEVAASSALSPFFFKAISSRIKQSRSVIILITGPPGEGKSYMAIRLGEILNDILTDRKRARKFYMADTPTPNPSEDRSQVIFEREHFLYLIGNDSPLRQGEVIVVDEAQFGADARRWMEALQQDVINQLEAVRSKGLIIIFVALHMERVDKIIRKFVLTYMIHLENRGIGLVYHLFTPRFEGNLHKRRLGRVRLNVPEHEYCKSEHDCLKCMFLHPKKGVTKCETLRAIYERRKKEFLGMQSEQAKKKAEQESLKRRLISDAEMLQTIYENHKELTLNPRSKRIEIEAIRILIRNRKEISIGINKAQNLRIRFEITYPNEMKQLQAKYLSRQ